MNLKKIFNLLFTSFLLLIIFILIQSIFNPWFLWEELIYHFEVFDLRGLTKGFIYLGTYFLAIIPFIIVLGLKSSRLFFVFLFSIFIFLSIDFFIQFLGVTHGFSLDEYALALNEAANYKYLIIYLDLIIQALALAFIIVAVLYFIRKKITTYRVSSKYLLFIFVSISIVYGGCYKIDTFKLSSYPAAIKIPLIMVENFRISTPTVDRNFNKNLKINQIKKFKNIVWIIDESVTGTYLSINGYKKETTPYLTKLNKESNEIYNFGVVNSVSNCSGESNLFLRIGLNPKKDFDLDKEVWTLPTIFEYAKKAGFKTWLFDSQTKKDHLQNYLTLYDKSDIDHFETLGSEVKRVDRDKIFLDKFSTIINNKNKKENNFIVVVKYGSHFPYLLTYDHVHSPFQPVMNVSYGGMDLEHKEEQINTYLNSIYSNVDLYLKEMLSKVDLSENIIFYTSDHGQNILEKESLTRLHCNSETVVKNEVSVPLMVFHENAKQLFNSSENIVYSQIQMFPTTLSFLGYEKSLIDKYGKMLYEGYSNSEEREYILSSSLERKTYK